MDRRIETLLEATMTGDLKQERREPDDRQQHRTHDGRRVGQCIVGTEEQYHRRHELDEHEGNDDAPGGQGMAALELRETIAIGQGKERVVHDLDVPDHPGHGQGGQDLKTENRIIHQGIPIRRT